MNKKTSAFMSRFEYTRLLAARVNQLNEGDPPLVSFNQENFDPFDIAQREIMERVVPLKIFRKLLDGTFEEWEISDLTIRDY